MKYIIWIALVSVFISCNSNSDKNTTTDEGGQTEIGGVENVNGNIPDTSAMGATPRSGNNTKPIDSSYADTANKAR
jgi:hypothetical protein